MTRRLSASASIYIKPPFASSFPPLRLIRKFDADGSGKIEFDEFCALVYTVANTVDKDTLRKELKEAFRLFDKEASAFA